MGKILCATRGGEGSDSTVDYAIALAQERGDELVFVFVADVCFLAQMAAPMVVDVERRLEDMGRFQLARIKKHASAQGLDTDTIVRRGRFRTEMVAAARDLAATSIILGHPQGQTSVFEEETLSAFVDSLQAETGIEVRVA